MLIVLLSLYHVFSASSAKHASLFPPPEGRHLFGNFQEENVGTSSRSVVWKQKLSWSNLIMRWSQMPARNLQTLFWPSPSSRILCDWSSQLRLGCRGSSFRGASCEDSFSWRQVVFLASLTACKITQAKRGQRAPLALQDQTMQLCFWGQWWDLLAGLIPFFSSFFPYYLLMKYFVSFILQLFRYSCSSEIDVTAVLSLFWPLLLAYKLDLLYPQHDL